MLTEGQEIFLHIGAPKTGSTTLQSFLFNNLEGLLRKGICIPDSHFLKQGGHALLGEAARKSAESVHEYLKTILDGTRFSKTLFTQETLCNPGSLPNFLEGLALGKVKTARLILCVRRQDLWFESLYTQGIASGTVTGSIEDFTSMAVESGFGDFNKVVQMALDSKAIQRVHVIDSGTGLYSSAEKVMRIVSGPLFDESWQQELRMRLNTQVSADLWPIINVAAHISPAQSNWARDEKGLIRRFVEILKERRFYGGRPLPRLMSPEFASKLMDSFRVSNEALAKSSGIYLDYLMPEGELLASESVQANSQSDEPDIEMHLLVAVLQLAWEVHNVEDRDWNVIMSDSDFELLQNYPWSDGWLR